MDLGEIYAYSTIDTCAREARVIMRSTSQLADGEAALHQIMDYYGHCDVMQNDAGSVFEGDFAEAVTRYAERHDIARPYKKNDQAFIECFNSILSQEHFHQAKYEESELSLAQHQADQYLDY